MKKALIPTLLAVCILLGLLSGVAPTANASDDNGANMYENSDFIEKEQPELTEETRQLIALYQNSPTEENYLKLREMVIENYNAVLERKEAKLAELKQETAGKPGGDAIVAEMEEIVQEMYISYWSRINSSMLRFTDPRLLQWRIASASRYEYIPVMGAGESIYIKRTPVTNAEYAEFVKETGTKAPSNWTDGIYPQGEDDYPVNFVSWQDAEAYCAWLTERDGVNAYRLPSESEWELAAGHMPKDADFNCGINDGRTPVDQYADVTRGAHGAIDFWGNVWEWTSTVRSDSGGVTMLGVKGGSWFSARTDCRTEYRKEGRNAAAGYEDVGFRVIQVLNGEEPEQAAELATLDAPVVAATAISADAIALSWQPVDGAVEYQIFEYFAETSLLRMLDRVNGTSVTMENLEPGVTYRYIVQPITYTSVADNVSPEYSVAVTCGQSAEWSETVSQAAAALELCEYGGMNCWLYTPVGAKANMPLIVYLHASSGKGDNPELLLNNGFPQWLSNGTLGEVPAYILMPQVPAGQKDWVAMKESVAGAIREVVNTYKIDGDNVSLTGFSMGGVGVWSIAASYPELFRCIAPCSGSVRINRETLSALGRMPVWTFIGTEDTAVDPQTTRDFMAQLSQINPQAQMTEFKGASHTDVSALAYLDEEIGLIRWLIEK